MERLVIPMCFVAVAAVFWGCPERWRMTFVASAFSALLLWIAPWPAAIMLAMSAGTFTVFKLPALAPIRSHWPGMALLLGAIALYLIITKYLPALAALTAWGTFPAQIIVPLGLSYLTFRLIHYAVEAQSGRLPTHAFDEFMAYAVFLPIFIAGPIERFDRFLAGRSVTLSAADLWQAGDRVIKGLIKAFALPALIMTALPEPTLAEAATRLLADPSQTSTAWVWCVLGIATLAYYLNFAGYSDIAIGAARLLGFKNSENFDTPFLSTSLVQFWSRWHITLGDWCRAYVFYPSSRVLRSAALGVLATFAAIGLWHEASVHWLFFGLWHGAGVLAVNAFRRRGWRLAPDARVASAIGWVLTTGFVVLGASFTLLSGRGSLWDSIQIVALGVGINL